MTYLFRRFLFFRFKLSPECLVHFLIISDSLSGAFPTLQTKHISIEGTSSLINRWLAPPTYKVAKGTALQILGHHSIYEKYKFKRT